MRGDGKLKNLDVTKTEILQRMKTAAESENAEEFAGAFLELANEIQNQVLDEARGLIDKQDTEILAQRGVRQLTSEEKKYYEKAIDAMRSSNPKQALSDMDDVLPKTTIDAVFDYLVTAHPLLDAINFQNTSGLIEYVVNKNTKQLATWGALTAEIVTELSSGFEILNLQHNKLSAFIPVAKSMLDLGPQWLDAYVRAVLGEALAFGLEAAIITGTGKNQPIGMNRQVGEGVSVTDGEYPEKTPIALSSFSPETYGSFVASLATDPNGNFRPIQNVLLICNPTDYLTKVMPATTLMRADGTYATNVFPIPTTVIQSVQVPQNRAIVGLANRYFMGIGTAKSGKLEYSDEYKFLEDERTYLIKLYGDGRPLDNNAFIYADISGLRPARMDVNVYYGDDTALSKLTVGDLTLSPAFASGVLNYTADAPNATTSVAVTAVARDGDATITIKKGATTITNGGNASLSVGSNALTITVTNGTASSVYTVNVTRAEA